VDDFICWRDQSVDNTVTAGICRNETHVLSRIMLWHHRYWATWARNSCSLCISITWPSTDISPRAALYLYTTCLKNDRRLFSRAKSSDFNHFGKQHPEETLHQKITNLLASPVNCWYNKVECAKSDFWQYSPVIFD